MVSIEGNRLRSPTATSKWIDMNVEDVDNKLFLIEVGGAAKAVLKLRGKSLSPFNAQDLLSIASDSL